MFKNYLQIAARNMLKFKAYTFINILGLGIGMACCLIILLYVLDELSFDTYHEKADQVYRVVLEKFEEGGLKSRTWAPISPGYGPKLQNEFAAIQHAARLWPWEFGVFSRGEHKYVESNFVFAEQAIFDIFSFSFISGDQNTALTEPNTVVLTRASAQKYFGDEDPAGKILQVQVRGSSLSLQVTGLIEDLPANSHFTFDFLISFVTWENVVGRENLTFLGGDFNYPTYLLLEENTSPAELTAQFPAFLDRNMAEIDGRKPHAVFKVHLQPLSEIYLHSNFDSDYATTGSMIYVYLFSSIALLVLLVACVNFINLSTARSIRRAQEVGVRKVLGAHRLQLIKQFLSESAALALVALLLAIVFVEMMLPAFNNFTGKDLSLNYASNLSILSGLLGLIFFVGCTAGGYPAFVLSSFQPVRVLKGGKAQSGAGKSTLRSVLVVFQFVVSIALFVSVGVVQKQLNYVRTQDLGFEKEQIVSLRSTSDILQNLESVKHRLRQHSGVISVSTSSRVPSGFLNDALNARVFKEGQAAPVGFRLPFIRVDHDFFDTFGIEVLAGRNFSPLISSDSTEAFVLNEIAIKELGWSSPQDAIGQEFGYGQSNGRIIGVVKDFHFESMHQKIKPILFYVSPFFMRRISVRIQPTNIAATLDFLKNQWQVYRPDFPFDYFFIDERFDLRYGAEDRLGDIFSLFSLLAAIVASLGLFGLATFTAEQRTKEIGVRKVLGASTAKIFATLSREILKLTLFANIFAWPIAYYFMRNWLDGFAYKTAMGSEIFIGAAGLAFVFALLTVCYQSIKAALANPVESLRYE